MKLKPTIGNNAAGNAKRARIALRDAEALTAELETKTTMCRAAWYAYGQALYEQKKLMPDTQQFGRWVRENRLNVGLAKSPSVRANAMWCAHMTDELQRCKSVITATHPTAIRRQYYGHVENEKRGERQLICVLSPIREAMRAGNDAAMGLQSNFRQMSAEQWVLREDLEEFQEHLQAVAAAGKEIVAFLSAHPEILDRAPANVRWDYEGGRYVEVSSLPL